VNTDRQQFENDKQNVDVPPGRISADTRFRFFVCSLITNCLFLSVLLISVAKQTASTRLLLLFHQNYL